MFRETPRQVPVRLWVLLRGALQGAIHDTEGGYEVLVRARERGGAAALCRGEPSMHAGRCAYGLAEELLPPVIAKLPCEVPQPEHVVEVIVHGVPSGRVVAGYGAELRLRFLGHQPRAEDFRPCGARGAPRGHPQSLVPGQEVAGRLLLRLAVVGPGKP